MDRVSPQVNDILRPIHLTFQHQPTHPISSLPSTSNTYGFFSEIFDKINQFLRGFHNEQNVPKPCFIDHLIHPQNMNNKGISPDIKFKVIRVNNYAPSFREAPRGLRDNGGGLLS
jgi:hypothetical protein